jgi:DNA-binding transcriptional regulator YhcF (GntR family)
MKWGHSMDNELSLKVDPHLTFSVNTQIREQLKWLIGIGKIRPGDRLPPANQLADRLGINRNTVNWVYTQLRDEGLVVMQKGRGTQVARSQAVAQLQEKRQAMHRLLTNTIGEASVAGAELGELFTAALAYTLLHQDTPTGKPRFVFVECKEHDYPFYRREIERVTGGEVRTVFLEDLRGAGSGAAEALAFSTIVVTTLNHAEEVRALLTGFEARIVTIGAAVHAPTLLEIAKLAPGTKVSFVCLGKAGGQWMASRVKEAGIAQIEAESFGLDDKASLASSLKRSDRIYASAAAYPEVSALAPGKVAIYPMVLEKSSESLLAETGSAR